MRNEPGRLVNRSSFRALSIFGGTAFLTGVFALAGWYLGLSIPLRLHPTWPVIAFNAAWLLAIGGGGLIAHRFHCARLTMACGGIVAAVGLLTYIQYPLGIDLHIDQFFAEDHFSGRAPYPGRMTLNAALAFSFVGLALLMLSLPVRYRQKNLFLGIIGGVLAMLALISPSAYLMSGEMTALSWDRIVGSGMSAILSFGFLVIGAGLLTYAWLQDRDAESVIPPWFPVVAGIAVMAGVLVVWQTLREREFLNAENTVKLAADSMATNIRLKLDTDIKGLLRMARYWESRGETPWPEWESDARLYEQHVPSFTSIEWVDSNLHLRWAVPSGEATRALSAQERLALHAAGLRREVRIISMATASGFGAERLLVYVPFNGRQGFTGYVRGRLNAQELLDAIFNLELPGFSVAVLADNREIYRRGNAGNAHPSAPGREAVLEMYGANLRVRVWPSSATAVASLRSDVPEIILGLGALLSLIVAFAIYFARKSWLHARLLYKANLSLSDEINGHLRDLDKLEKSEHQYQDLMEHAADGIFITDTAGNLLGINRSACEMTGYTREELLRLNTTQLFPAEDMAARPLRLPEVLAGQTVIIERSLLRRDGTTLPVEVNVKLIGNRLQAIARDISERHAADLQMRKLSGALAQTDDPIIITDVNGAIEYVNPAFEKVSGYSLNEARGNTPRILQSGRHKEEFYQGLWSTIRSGQPFHDVFINRCKDGSLYYEEKTITPIKDECGRITHFISTGKSMVAHQPMQERLRYVTQHDILTQLPNRALFMDRLACAVSHNQRNRQPLVVLLIDIDDLSSVNDTLGHDVGDRLLQMMAERLDACMQDQGIVARLGGDEFGIIIGSAPTVQQVSVEIRGIRLALSPGYIVDDQVISITVSIGVCFYPDDGEDASTLIMNAAMAIDRAREQGKNNIGFYRVDLDTKLAERLNFEADLYRALEQNEFLLRYQPQMNISTRQVCGLEAQLCWQHPKLGLLTSRDFLSLLEETGLIVPVGEWMLRAACEQNRDWQATGLIAVPVAVNVSYQQFGNPEYADRVARILDETGLAPCFIHLEISDRILSREARGARRASGDTNAKRPWRRNYCG